MSAYISGGVKFGSGASRLLFLFCTNEGYNYALFSLWRCGPTWAMTSLFLRFLDHTQRRITVGRTPLDEWSARRRDLYLTTHNTHNRQISIPPVGFEPMISACERPQTNALDRPATGTGSIMNFGCNKIKTDFRNSAYVFLFMSRQP